MKLKPLGDRVIVRTVDQEDVTASGIVLPDTAQEKPQRGVIVAVGDGRVVDGERIPLDVSDGDEVIYSKYGGTEVRLEGEDVLILSESDILARVAATPKAPAKRTASRKPAAKKAAKKK
jgi:chaperonin GroES